MSTAARPSFATRSAPARSSLAPWTLFGADCLALEISFLLGLAVRQLLGNWFTASIGLDQYLAVAAGILLLPIINYQLGLYRGYLLGPVERLRRRTLATLAVFGGLVAWDHLVARGVLSRGVLLATLLCALVLPPLAESFARWALIRRGRWGVPVVILGAGATGRSLAHMLQSEPDFGLQPVAFFDNRPDTWHSSVSNVPVAGPLGLASDYSHRAHAAIVCLSDLDQADLGALLHELDFSRVIIVPDLAGFANLWVTARPLGDFLGLELKKNLLLPRNHVLKTMMDQAITLPVFILSIPFVALAAVWIRLTTGGPAFYRQFREGQHGKPIPVWKLRTMHTDGDRILEEWFQNHPEDREHWQRFFKLPHDPRLLPVIGSLLRRTSLDELPQLWSVLRGEMSLVGPRPLPEYHVRQLPDDFRALRSRVPPGITGLWQVSARGDGEIKVQEALDTFYIRNWSPWLDLYILARTVTAVALARGAY